jgi:hypothetical protein
MPKEFVDDISKGYDIKKVPADGVTIQGTTLGILIN